MPASLESELEEVLVERGLRPREARRIGLELTDRLKALSHTPQRGGFGPASAKLSPPPGGRLRGAELRAALEAFEAGELLCMGEREVNAVLGLSPPLRDDQRQAPQMEKLAPRYKNESEVLAYVVARLAPEYVVCRRVFDEAVRLLAAAEALPGAEAVKWRPREALVHGAGVGAPVVALLEACVSPPLARVVAMEASSLRQMLGVRIVQAHCQKQRQEQLMKEGDEQGFAEQQSGVSGWHHGKRQRKQQETTDPLVSWVQTLPPLTKAATSQRRRYDLVIAPYQLTLLPTAEERQRLVRDLWDRCADVLILVEPGTPRGFAAVAEARELVLGREARKRAQLEVAAASASGGWRQGGGGAPDPRTTNKLRGTGAYVVAPCPHDGVCPMQASKRHWCHFSQRLQLPSFMQQAMASPAADRAPGRGRALNVQDERFSYVILRRGPRPAFRVAVSREFDSALGSHESGLVPAAAQPLVPRRLPARAVLNQVLLNRSAGAAAQIDGSLNAAAATAAAASRDPLGCFPEEAGCPSGGDLGTRPATRRAPLFGREHPTASNPVVTSDSNSTGQRVARMQDPKAEAAQAGPSTWPPVHGGPSDPAGHSNSSGIVGWGVGGSAAAAALAAGCNTGRGLVITAFTRKYPSFGPGLVGRLVALQDAGMDWASLGKADADGHEADDVLEADAAGSRSLQGAGAGGADGGNANLRSRGLDAALAELSLSMLGGSHAERGTATLGVSDVRGSAGDTSAAAATGGSMRPGGVMQERSDGQGLSTNWQQMADPYPQAPERQQQHLLQPLAREDVSDEEYERAEQLLVERIYGTAAACAWLADRRSYEHGGAGGADSSTSDADEDLMGFGASWSGPEVEAAAPEERRDGDVLMEEDEEEALDGCDEQELATGREFQANPSTRAALRTAEASSYGWGRLVRAPRLRGGHVILDMCVGPQHHYPDSIEAAPAAAASVQPQEHVGAAASAQQASGDAPPSTSAVSAPAAAGDAVAGDAAASASGTVASGPDTRESARPHGRLVQQVVAKSARRGWMGAPAYRLARRLSWGDCWPDWYIRAHNSRETTSQRAAPAEAAEPDDEPRHGSGR